MSDQKTVKVDTGPGSSGDPFRSGYAPERNATGSAPGGSWEETKYVDPNVPTPRRGDLPWPPATEAANPPAREAPAWGRGEPNQAGAKTVFLDDKSRQEPAFAWLVMTAGAAGNRQIGLPLPVRNNTVTTIGRVPGNTIVVPDPACSSQHAKIRMETDADGNQAFVIYDLASSNGLYAGSKETYRDESSRVYRHVLQDGVYLLIGETTLVFKQI